MRFRSLGWEDPQGGGHGNPLQYSFPRNPTDRGAWWAVVHRVTKSQTRLSTHTCILPWVTREVPWLLWPLRGLFVLGLELLLSATSSLRILEIPGTAFAFCLHGLIHPSYFMEMNHTIYECLCSDFFNLPWFQGSFIL